jgi:hypothetical protein
VRVRIEILLPPATQLQPLSHQLSHRASVPAGASSSGLRCLHPLVDANVMLPMQDVRAWVG